MRNFAILEAADRETSLATPPSSSDPAKRDPFGSDPPRSDPDAPLAVRLAGGDEAALALLMERHGGRLRQLARRMTGRNSEADDIVQEAFLAVWRRGRRLEDIGAPLGAYLTRTVVNRCIDRARRERLFRMIGLERPDELEDETPGAEAVLSARSEVRAVARDLRDLPARQRAAILLASTGEQSTAAIAETMGLSVGAAEQLLVRARRTLRQRASERLRPSEG